MGYTDYYIKAPSKEAFDAVIPTETNGYYEGETPVTETVRVGWDGVVFDRVGTIFRDTGQTFEVNGEVRPILEATEGYHVNVRVADGVSLPEALEQFVIPAPANPKRVWA